MPVSFPKRFDLAQMNGPSAKAFANRSDAFQQLIGDGLRAMSGRFARCYPTKGEDGGIDSFLDIDAPLVIPFSGIPLPAIVECKEHDDSLSRFKENIQDEWGRVRQKLAKYAEKGWSGRFQPWREAKTYIYIVSAVMPTEDLWQKVNNRPYSP